MARRPDGPVRWPLPTGPSTVQQQRGPRPAAQLKVFLTGTARTRHCFGESDPARERHCDSGLYNLNGRPGAGPMACPVAAALYGATVAGAAQLAVFLTGTARTLHCFGESDPARDRDCGLYILNGRPQTSPGPIIG